MEHDGKICLPHRARCSRSRRVRREQWVGTWPEPALPVSHARRGMSIASTLGAQLKQLPTVIASPGTNKSLALVLCDGVEASGNRDAADVLFVLRLQPHGPEKLLAVRLSGTVMSIRPETFGFLPTENRTSTFLTYAEAAIGDALDSGGLPDLDSRGGTYHAIDCFSPHLQAWRDRPPLTDEEVEEYLYAHVVAAWQFTQASWVLGPSDFLRLNRTMADVMRLVKLHEGEAWTLSEVTPSKVTLTPTPVFLREYRAKLKEGLVRERPAHAPSAEGTATFGYVDDKRIADLKRLDITGFDLAKLIALCEELNLCYRAQCYHAVAALTRALIDHVPPLFGCSSFAAVAATGSRSFKDSMAVLNSLARKIADQHLHGQIRESESLPTRVQVDFSQAVDVLLGEVVRVLRSKGTAS